MKKTHSLILLLFLFIGIALFKIPSYASEKKEHSKIPGQSINYSDDNTEISGSEKSTTIIENKVPNEVISDAPSAPPLSNSVFSQSYWLSKIPNEIIPIKIKGYIIQAVNSYTIFATIILAVLFAFLGSAAMDEQKTKMAKRALEILISSIIVMNLLSPIIHLGLWMAGAL